MESLPPPSHPIRDGAKKNIPILLPPPPSPTQPSSQILPFPRMSPLPDPHSIPNIHINPIRISVLPSINHIFFNRSQ
jgi:hypothetical protein